MGQVLQIIYNIHDFLGEVVQVPIPAQQSRITILGQQDNAEDLHLSAKFALLNDEQKGYLIEHIKDALEQIREVIINGNENLPRFDPFCNEKMGPFEHLTNGNHFSGTIKNLRVEGLRGYVVNEVTCNANLLTFRVHLTLPWLRINGIYNAQAAIVGVNHESGGNFRISMNLLEVCVDFRIGANVRENNLVVRQLDNKIDIHDTMIQMDGMFGSSVLNNLIIGFVRNLKQDVIKAEYDFMSVFLSEKLFDEVDDLLKQFQFTDIPG